MYNYKKNQTIDYPHAYIRDPFNNLPIYLQGELCTLLDVYRNVFKERVKFP